MRNFSQHSQNVSWAENAWSKVNNGWSGQCDIFCNLKDKTVYERVKRSVCVCVCGKHESMTLEAPKDSASKGTMI